MEMYEGFIKYTDVITEIKKKIDEMLTKIFLLFY